MYSMASQNAFTQRQEYVGGRLNAASMEGATTKLKKGRKVTFSDDVDSNYRGSVIGKIKDLLVEVDRIHQAEENQLKKKQEEERNAFLAKQDKERQEFVQRQQQEGAMFRILQTDQMITLREQHAQESLSMIRNNNAFLCPHRADGFFSAARDSGGESSLTTSPLSSNSGGEDAAGSLPASNNSGSLDSINSSTSNSGAAGGWTIESCPGWSADTTAQNRGWAPRNDGSATKNEGWAPKNVGWAANNEGWAPKNGRSAPNNGGWAPNNTGWTCPDGRTLAAAPVAVIESADQYNGGILVLAALGDGLHYQTSGQHSSVTPGGAGKP